MMELKSICKSFGENEVLRDISMIIPKGGRVLITAPSGRGKTTLLRIMMGLEAPDSGEIKNRPRRQAAVFQEDRLPEEFHARKLRENDLRTRRDKGAYPRKPCSGRA